MTIQPTGLEIDNSEVVREADGMVVGAEIADLDRSPEIYVYLQSAGSGSCDSLVAFSANE